MSPKQRSNKSRFYWCVFRAAENIGFVICYGSYGTQAGSNVFLESPCLAVPRRTVCIDIRFFIIDLLSIKSFHFHKCIFLSFCFHLDLRLVHCVDCTLGHVECFHYLLLFGSRRTFQGKVSHNSLGL